MFAKAPFVYKYPHAFMSIYTVAQLFTKHLFSTACLYACLFPVYVNVYIFVELSQSHNILTLKQ